MAVPPVSVVILHRGLIARPCWGGLIHQQCERLCLTAVCQTQSGVGEDGEVCLGLGSASMLWPHIGRPKMNNLPHSIIELFCYANYHVKENRNGF